MSELSTAHAVFDLTASQRPGELLMLCQKAPVIRRSDRLPRPVGSAAERASAALLLGGL